MTLDRLSATILAAAFLGGIPLIVLFFSLEGVLPTPARVFMLLAPAAGWAAVAVGIAHSLYYPRYLQAKIDRLKQRGAFAQAVPLARRLVVLERRHWGRLLAYVTGDLHTIDRASYEAGDGGRVVQVGELLLETGQFDEAERLINEALDHARGVAAQETFGYAVLLITLAGIYQKRGAIAAARPLLEQALAIQRRAIQNSPPRPTPSPSGKPANGKPEDDPRYVNMGVTLSGLGVVYQALGDYPAAVRAYEEALAIFRTLPSLTRESLGTTLNNLGTLYVEMCDLDRGGDVLRQTVEHIRSTHGDRHPRFATAILNLAIWHETKRQYPDALQLTRESVRIRAEVLGTTSTEYIHALNNLACTLHQTGDFKAATPLADEALSGRPALGEDHPLATGLLSTRAALDVVEGRLANALAQYRELFVSERQVIGRLFAVASDAQRLVYLDKVRRRMFQFLSLVNTCFSDNPAVVGEAYDLVLGRKALAAEATTAQRDAALSGRYPSLATQLRELFRLRQQIAARMLAGPGSEGAAVHRQLLAGWQERQAALEVQLAGAIPQIGLEQRLLTADRRAVAAALPADSALIEFIRFDPFDFRAVPARGEEPWRPARYLAFVLRPEAPSAVRMVDLGEADAIERLVWAFRADLLGPGASPSRGMALLEEDGAASSAPSPGAALRERVFDPLREAVGGIHHLVVAPDGELSVLTFGLLPDPDGRPLIGDFGFSYLAVGRDALRTGVEQWEAGEAFVIAGPDFELGSAAADGGESDRLEIRTGALSRDLNPSALRFPVLPGSLEEGKEVAGLLGVKPVVGTAAVEARVKRLAAPRVLHVATHGFFLPDQPVNQEGAANDWTGRLWGVTSESPLLRSGLALAGANTWLAGGTPPAEAEDGLLTAVDVTGLDLLGTELVVLSACETGLGQVRAGEGVFGLRRAFQLAGARTVVMSLWKVPDEPTRALMRDFYRHLQAGLPRAEALRRAQLELKARYPHPRNWGAFILQGDPSPLPAVPGQADSAHRQGEPSLPGSGGEAKEPDRRVVYDVLNDVRFRTEDCGRLVGALLLYAGIACFVLIAFLVGHLLAAVPSKPGDMQEIAVSLINFSVLYWIFFGIIILAWAWDQRWCRYCLRAGAFTTTEGPVSCCQTAVSGVVNLPSTGNVTFQVADQCFTVKTDTWRGGFRLRGVPGVQDHTDFLEDGAWLRVLHRGGRILRIEVLDKATACSDLTSGCAATPPVPGSRDTSTQAAPAGRSSGVRPLNLPIVIGWGTAIATCMILGSALPLLAWHDWSLGGLSLSFVLFNCFAGACLLLSGVVLLRGLIRRHREEPDLDSLRAAFLRRGLYTVTAGLSVLIVVVATRGTRVAIDCLAFSPDGTRLAVGCSDGRVRLFDGPRPARADAVSLAVPGAVTNLAWAPDGSRFIASCQPEMDRAADRVVIVDARSGEVLRDWPAKVASLGRALSWSGDGDLVAWRDDTRALVADAATGAVRLTLSYEKGPASLAFSPDGRRLAVGLWNGQVSVCNVATGKELVALKKLSVGVTCLAWSADGQRLAGGGAFGQYKGDLRLWDAATGKPIATMQEKAVPGTFGGSLEIRGLAFDPGGDRFASICGIGVKVWNGRTGVLEADLTEMGIS